MRAMRASVGTATVLVLGGCFDFEPVTGPGQPGPAPVVVGISAQFGASHFGGPVADVMVQLTPGRDEQGSRPVLGDTLWVDDEPVLPIHVGHHGERTYSWEGVASESGELRLRFPRLGRVGSLPPEFRVTRPAHLLADTLRIAPAQELVVPLPALDDAEPSRADEFEAWSFAILGSTGRFEVMQSGPPPTTIAVPPAMRPAPRDDGTLFADFWYRVEWRPVAEPDLEVFLRQSVRLAWIVEVVAPSGSAALP